MLFLVYATVIPYTKCEHLGSFVFELCCVQTQRQTNKQTDAGEHLTHADRLCRHGKQKMINRYLECRTPYKWHKLSLHIAHNTLRINSNFPRITLLATGPSEVS